MEIKPKPPPVKPIAAGFEGAPQMPIEGRPSDVLVGTTLNGKAKQEIQAVFAEASTTDAGAARPTLEKAASITNVTTQEAAPVNEQTREILDLTKRIQSELLDIRSALILTAALAGDLNNSPLATEVTLGLLDQLSTAATNPTIVGEVSSKRKALKEIRQHVTALMERAKAAGRESLLRAFMNEHDVPSAMSEQDYLAKFLLQKSPDALPAQVRDALWNEIKGKNIQSPPGTSEQIQNALIASGVKLRSGDVNLINQSLDKASPSPKRDAQPDKLTNEAKADEAKNERFKSKEKTDPVLADLCKLLYELKDNRLKLAALGRNMADTPIGNEFRYHILRQLDDIHLPKNASEKQQEMAATIRREVKKLYPIAKPTAQFTAEDSPLYRFLKARNVPKEMLDQQHLKGTPPHKIIASILEDENMAGIATALWEQIKSPDLTQAPYGTPGEILGAAGVHPADYKALIEAKKHLDGIEKIQKKFKLDPQTMVMVVMALAAAGITATQIASVDDPSAHAAGGGGGHQA